MVIFIVAQPNTLCNKLIVVLRAIAKSEREHPELVEGCGSSDELGLTRTLRLAQGASLQVVNGLCNSSAVALSVTKVASGWHFPSHFKKITTFPFRQIAGR